MSGENTLYATICVPCKGSGRVTFIDGERKCFNCGGKGWVYVDNPEKRSDKMKLSEAIKELEKDRNKIYESKDVKLYTSKGKYLHFSNTIIETQIGCINLDREWEKVLQPITFDEVLNNGKVFKCKHPKIKEEGYWVLSRFISMLYIEEFDSAEIIDIIQKGKFYN